MNKIKLICVLCFLVFGVAAFFTDNGLVQTVQSYSSGPPLGFTGAPDEQSCSLCHDETPGPGVFTINAPTNYVPGQTYQIQVQHSTTEASRLRWGFEMTAIDGTNVGAGTFTNTDGFTATDVDFGTNRYYVFHTSTGTFPGTSNGASWTFNWNAPATNLGPVTFYAAGNQANNNDNPNLDWIYLTNTASLGPTPTVTIINPISGPTIGGNVVTITGTNFISPATVTIGGNPGLNVIILDSMTIDFTVPPGTAGPANVVVTTPNGTSNGVFYTYADPTPTNTNTPTATATATPCGPTVVTNTGDSGAGSLRDTIANACDGATITFDLGPGPNTIGSATSLSLIINKNLTISGPGADVLEVADSNVAESLFIIQSGKTVTIEDLKIRDGENLLSLPTGGGGAISNQHGTLTVRRCIFVDNQGSVGGAIMNNGGDGGPTATLDVIQSTFENNSASGSGAAIYSRGANGGNAVVRITNSTFSANSGNSGVVYNDGDAGLATMTVTNSTFNNNGVSATLTNVGTNSGVANLTIGNTILNASATNHISNGFGTVTSLGYNIANDNGGGFLTSTGDQINTNPLLGPLQNNGGATQTHAPSSTSPALDRGKDIGPVGPGYNPTGQDQRGSSRPVTYSISITPPSGGDRSDIGAVELGAPTPTNTNTPTPTPTCFTVTTFSGAEEVPPNGSTGTGTGTVSVNAAQTQITVTLNWSGLSSNANAAHIHGPAPAGSNAPVLFGMAGVPTSPTGSISPSSQTFSITPAQLTNFQNGLFYWNVHSANFGPGEIRGQILPGPCLATPTPTATSTLTPTNTPTSTATAAATDTPTATATATETATPGGASISGTITYGNAIGNPAPPRFVKNVSVFGTGSPPVGPVLTGLNGQYTLTGFGPGPYTIRATKVGGPNGAITSNDAARVAQGVVSAPAFVSQNQRFAADTSGNGGVTSNDAALIARFAAGLSGTQRAGQWFFFVTGAPSPLPTAPQTYNDNRTYDNIVAPGLTDQDYIGLLVGEVTGNYNTATHSRAVVGGQRSVVSAEKPITVMAEHVVKAADKEIVIPISVQGVADKELISYEFDLRYDPTVIQPLSDSVDVIGTVSRGLFVVTNPHEPGLLRVVVYGPMPIDENGLLLNLRFTAVGAVGAVSPLTFERIMFNEGESNVMVTDGRIEISALLTE